MNCETTKLVQARQEEVNKLGGPAAFTLHALRNLRVKTVIKVWPAWKWEDSAAAPSLSVGAAGGWGGR